MDNIKWAPQFFQIPYDIYTDKELNKTDCFLWSLIAMMPDQEGCFLSNQSLSEILLVSQPIISKSVSVLHQNGYVNCRFDGKKRVVFLTEKSKILRKKVETHNTLNLLKNQNSAYKKSFRQGKRKVLHKKIIYNNIISFPDTSSDKSSEVFQRNDVMCFPEENTGVVALKKPLLDNEYKPSTIIRENKDTILYSDKSKTITYSQAFIDLVALWNGLGLHRHKNLQSQVIQLAHKEYVRLRGDKNLNLQQCVANLAKAAFDPNYEPSNGFKEKLGKITLLQFFKDPYTKKEWHKNFIDPPKLSAKKRYNIAERYPQLVNKIKKYYADKCFGGAHEFTSKQEEDFMVCAGKAVEYGKKYKNRFYDWVDTSPAKMVEYVLSALECTVINDLRGEWNRITSGWLSSDTMFNDRLPKYLYAEALFIQKED